MRRRIEQLPQRRARQADEMAGVERFVEIVFTEPELGQFQQRMAWQCVAERIEPGQEVAEVAIGIDKANDAGLGAAIHATAGRRSLPKFEALEEQTPTLIHGSGIGPPTLVFGFDDVEVSAHGKGRTYHEQ